ncbi:MAG: hypothetical protein IJ639_01140 [Ruminococcus sp.]|nr:hypothetical protein [Ruminococcus sp.]
MKKGGGVTITILIIILIVVAISSISSSNNTKDEWHNFDGSEIVCRVNGCGKKPVYSNWDKRFCSEHLYKISNNQSGISSNASSAKQTKRINTTPALTKEQGDALRGTGYHNTRPNSSAENTEIAAAMTKCKVCGMHTDNGLNSLCDECQYNREHGLE